MALRQSDKSLYTLCYFKPGARPPLGTMFGDASRSGRRAGLAGTPHPGNVLAGPLLSAREFSVFPVEAGIFADFPVSASIGARKG